MQSPPPPTNPLKTSGPLPPTYPPTIWTCPHSSAAKPKRPRVNSWLQVGAYFMLETNVNSLFPSASPCFKEGVKGEDSLVEPSFAFLKFLFPHGRIEH